VGDDARVDAERREGLAAALAVHDDRVEAAQERAPERLLAGRPARQEIVRGEDRRRVWAEEHAVELGDEPLHVQDVRASRPQRGEAERMLRDLERQPQGRASEEPRRERVEELASPVAVGGGRLAEAEARRDELDVGARRRERGRERVVVRGRERGRIGEDDAHEGS